MKNVYEVLRQKELEVSVEIRIGSQTPQMYGCFIGSNRTP
jgi:N-acetylglutamate synthase/N-acetylornithine aminotransferase